MQADSGSKLITCILPKGAGLPLLEAIHKLGVTTTNLCFSRGSDYGDPTGKSGSPEQVEKEIVTVTVKGEESEELFDLMHETANIDRPGGGLIYMTRLRKSVPFALPDIPAEQTK